jgi:hypothetical protein
MKQKSVGHGLDSFRPDAHSLSITTRLEKAIGKGVKQPPMFFAWATLDDKVQLMDKTLALLEKYHGETQIWRVEGADHGFDEASGEQCEEFRDWLGKTLI